MTSSGHYWVLLILGFILFAIPNIGTTGEVVKSILPNKIKVTAFYHQGNEKSPAILLVHGFLQTRNYQTVTSLSNSLADEEYTVLTPTLSLGISLRQRSLACEAIHVHTMQSDVKEISYWVNWLVEKGHKEIILVGHSYGSLQVIVYASGKSNPAVKKIIATSLVDAEHVLGKENLYRQIKSARRDIKKDKTALQEFQISYCKKFVAPPKVFLSYAEWTKENILKSLKDIKVPTEVILGSNDARMAPEWPSNIKNTGTTVSMVKDANHFFSSAQEFDLFDGVQSSIDRVAVGK